MNNYFEHMLDRYIGKILCFLFSQVEKIRRVFQKKGDSAAPGKILFVKPVEQGAIILALPALKRAVDAVGRENVYFFCLRKNRVILDILDVLPRENVFTVDDRSLFSFAAGLIHAVFQLRRLKIDTAIDLEIFARISIIIAWFSGARRRVGLHRFNSEGPYRGNLVTHKVQYNPYIHTSQTFEVLVCAAFADPADTPLLKEPIPELWEALPQFQPAPEDREEAFRLLKTRLPGWTEETAAKDTLILFNPKCLDELPVRKWPDSSFVALGRKILQSYPEATILITGLENEKAACEAMAREIGDGAISLAGVLSLRGLLALMTVCRVLVSTDSGPAHFAALTDLAGVILFGPETPDLYSPLSSRMKLIYRHLTCSPCFSPMNYRLSPCRNNQCVLQITPDQVFDAVSEILEG